MQKTVDEACGYAVCDCMDAVPLVLLVRCGTSASNETQKKLNNCLDDYCCSFWEMMRGKEFQKGGGLRIASINDAGAIVDKRVGLLALGPWEGPSVGGWFRRPFLTYFRKYVEEAKKLKRNLSIFLTVTNKRSFIRSNVPKRFNVLTVKNKISF